MDVAHVTIADRAGLHLRVASAVARAVQTYDATVRLSCDGARFVDGRSVTQLMIMGAAYGAKVTVQAEGPEEHAAVQAVSAALSQAPGL